MKFLKLSLFSLTLSLSMAPKANAGILFATSGNIPLTFTGGAMIVAGIGGLAVTAKACENEMYGTAKEDFICGLFFYMVMPASGMMIVLDEESKLSVTDKLLSSKHSELFLENPDAMVYLSQSVSQKAMNQVDGVTSEIQVELTPAEIKAAFMNSDVDFESVEFQTLVNDLI